MLSNCYTLNKSEIVFRFSNGKEEEILKGFFGEQSFLFMPPSIVHPSKHIKNIFEEIEAKKVVSSVVHYQDRSFRIAFEDGFTLVFMIYGRNGNVLLFKNNEVIDIFRSQFEKHNALHLADFNTSGDLTFEEYEILSQKEGAIKAIKTLFKGFSSGMIGYLESHKLNSKSIEEQWKSIHNLDALLNTGTTDVIKSNNNIILTLLPGSDSEELLFSGTDVIEALNQYSKHYFYEKNFQGLRNKKLNSINTKIEKASRQLETSKHHLHHLENDSNYKHVADIIMANLHIIEVGAEKVTLFDFYNNADIEISLKRTMTPQSHAEKLYRKSKNQEIEKQKTIEKISNLELEMQNLEKERSDFEQITDFKEMKQSVKSIEKEESQPELPFRHFVEGEYDIYVGKSATNNDELTFDFSHKEDMWLHARDVSGSHVIIKHKQNGVFPKPVIERAAQIAAYYSKSKGSIMSPVIYTLRKFVRKPKGAAHGSVICEKEKMIMVAPAINQTQKS